MQNCTHTAKAGVWVQNFKLASEEPKSTNKLKQNEVIKLYNFAVVSIIFMPCELFAMAIQASCHTAGGCLCLLSWIVSN